MEERGRAASEKALRQSNAAFAMEAFIVVVGGGREKINYRPDWSMI